MSVAGIDFGSKSNVVALARRKGIDVVMNEESKRETPSLINFGDKCVVSWMRLIFDFSSSVFEKKERTDRPSQHATHTRRERERVCVWNERAKKNARVGYSRIARFVLPSRSWWISPSPMEFECVGGDDERRRWKLPSSLFFLRRFVFFSFSIWGTFRAPKT